MQRNKKLGPSNRTFSHKFSSRKNFTGNFQRNRKISRMKLEKFFHKNFLIHSVTSSSENRQNKNQNTTNTIRKNVKRQLSRRKSSDEFTRKEIFYVLGRLIRPLETYVQVVVFYFLGELKLCCVVRCIEFSEKYLYSYIKECGFKVSDHLSVTVFAIFSVLCRILIHYVK